MNTTVAFSVLAAISMAAIPASAGAGCVGSHQSKVVSTSQPAPVVAAPATETAASQTAQAETPAASSGSNVVADLAATDAPAKVKAE
jgi:hypothetical protein